MSDEATENTDQASGSNGNAGTDQESGQQNGTTGQESGGQQGNQQDQQSDTNSIDLDAIQDPELKAKIGKALHEANKAAKEAARYRTERNQFREQVQTFQRQNESEQERAEREANEARERLEALQRENRELKVGQQVTKAAEGAKALNPATVAALIGNRVETDEAGNPTNLQELLTELRTSDPYLFKRADADAGAGRGQGGAVGSTMNDLIRGAVHARKGTL